jgi:hypothetical protein
MKVQRLFVIALLLALATPALAEQRDPAAVRQFIQQNPPPGPRSNFVVDHIVPLIQGGTNALSNMQWQTIPDAKAKDRVECDGHRCGR